jgi:hypothetical protein
MSEKLQTQSVNEQSQLQQAPGANEPGGSAAGSGGRLRIQRGQPMAPAPCTSRCSCSSRCNCSSRCKVKSI